MKKIILLSAAISAGFVCGVVRADSHADEIRAGCSAAVSDHASRLLGANSRIKWSVEDVAVRSWGTGCNVSITFRSGGQIDKEVWLVGQDDGAYSVVSARLFGAETAR